MYWLPRRRHTPLRTRYTNRLNPENNRGSRYVSLPLLRRPAAAAVDRYILLAGPAAANPPHAAAAVDRWDRQTDGRTPYRYIDSAAYYASSVSNGDETH